MTTLQPHSNPQSNSQSNQAWRWLYACGVAFEVFALSGCASMRETAVGMHVSRNAGATVPVDASVETVVVSLTAEVDTTPTRHPAADAESSFRSASAHARPVTHTAAVRQAFRPTRFAAPQLPQGIQVVCEQSMPGTPLCAVNSPETVGSAVRPSPRVATQSVDFIPTGPLLGVHQNGMVLPVANEQPYQPFFKRLMSPFSSDAPVGDPENDDLFSTLGETSQADSGPGGPDDGPGGPEGGPPGGFGGPGDEPGLGVTWYPSAAVSGQGTELGVLRNRLGVDVPVWFQGADAIMLSLSLDESHFSGEALLPDSLRELPPDLWNIQVGLKHMRQLKNGWTSMLMFDIGSASDQPFHSLRELSFQIGGFLMIPAKNERDMWMVGAFYSPLGSPNFPIPLLSYNWKPSETFEMSIGLPFHMKWRPMQRLSVDLSYMPLLTVNALATYELSDQMSVYGGYQNISDSYFLADRVNQGDQFFAVEQRVVMGLRRKLSEKVTLDLSAGYAFDRHFGVGEDQQKLHDRVNLESGAFLSGQLMWNF